MVKELKTIDFDKNIKIDGKILVDCYATWCNPCKMLSPIIEELSSSLPNIVFYKVDVDSNEEISEKYNIMSIPTLLLFENGELKKRTTGFKTKEELIDFIENE